MFCWNDISFLFQSTDAAVDSTMTLSKPTTASTDESFGISVIYNMQSSVFSFSRKIIIVIACAFIFVLLSIITGIILYKKYNCFCIAKRNGHPLTLDSTTYIDMQEVFNEKTK